MRQVVKRVADIRLGEDGAAQLAGEHQRGDAGDLGLEREDLQIHQQLQVLLERRRHARRHFRQRQVIGNRGLRALNPPLDLPHVVEELAQADAVRRRQILLEPRNLIHHRIQDASRLLPAAAALGARAAVAEQFFEDEARVVLHRQRRGRGLPRDGVSVRAAERRLAREHRFFDGQLERGKRRVLPDVLRRDLIDGGAEVRLRPLSGTDPVRNTAAARVWLAPAETSAPPPPAT